MTPATEKAAPIPAEVLALARETVAQVHEAEGNHHAAFRVREGYMDDRAPMLVALRLLADQVSQEERIREDEPMAGGPAPDRIWATGDGRNGSWIAEELRAEWQTGAVEYVRARLRGDAS